MTILGANKEAYVDLRYSGALSEANSGLIENATTESVVYRSTIPKEIATTAAKGFTLLATLSGIKDAYNT